MTTARQNHPATTRYSPKLRKGERCHPDSVRTAAVAASKTSSTLVRIIGIRGKSVDAFKL